MLFLACALVAVPAVAHLQDHEAFRVTTAAADGSATASGIRLAGSTTASRVAATLGAAEATLDAAADALGSVNKARTDPTTPEPTPPPTPEPTAAGGGGGGGGGVTFPVVPAQNDNGNGAGNCTALNFTRTKCAATDCTANAISGTDECTKCDQANCEIAKGYSNTQYDNGPEGLYNCRWIPGSGAGDGTCTSQLDYCVDVLVDDAGTTTCDNVTDFKFCTNGPPDLSTTTDPPDSRPSWQKCYQSSTR